MLARSLRQRLKWREKGYATHHMIHVKACPATVLPTSEQDTTAVKEMRDMPEAKGLPFFGTMLDGTFPIEKFHLRLKDRISKLGMIFREKPAIGLGEQVFTANVDDVKRFYQQESRQQFAHRTPVWSLEAYEKLRNRKGSIVEADPVEKKRIRGSVQARMLRPAQVAKFLPLLSEISADFASRLLSEASKNGGFYVDVHALVQRWALEAGGAVVFSQRLGCLDKNIPHGSEIQKLIAASVQLFPTMAQLEMGLPHHRLQMSPLWNQWVTIMDTIYDAGGRIIAGAQAKHDESGTDDTFIDWLVAREDLNDEERVTICAQLLSAAIDTTSNTATMNLYNLAVNPEVQEELAEELIRVIPDPKAVITMGMIQKLPFLKACITESFRHTSPIVILGKRLETDIVLSGYRVPANTAINMMVGPMCQRDDYFKDSNTFNPHRHLGETKEDTAFRVMPFGHGPSSCLGRRAATMEIQTLVARVIRCTRIEYIGQESVGMNFQMLMTPDRKVDLNVQPRC